MDQSWAKTIWNGSGGTIVAAIVTVGASLAVAAYTSRTPKDLPAEVPAVVAEATPLPKPEVNTLPTEATGEAWSVQPVAAYEPARKSVLQPFPLTIEVRYSLYYLEGRHVQIDDIIKLLRWGAFDGNGCDVTIAQYDQSEPNVKASAALQEAIRNSGISPHNIRAGQRRSVLAD